LKSLKECLDYPPHLNRFPPRHGPVGQYLSSTVHSQALEYVNLNHSLLHLTAIYAFCFLKYGSQPISYILLTNRTSNTILFVVGIIPMMAYGTCMTGTVCVVELVMPSITTLTIWMRSLGSIFGEGTNVGIVEGTSTPLYGPAPIECTFFVWFGASSSLAFLVFPCKDSNGLTNCSSSCQS
jgi:hypothetical protein